MLLLPRRLAAVQLVAARRCNVTVKAAPPRRRGAARLEFSVAWPAAATCQARLELAPWQPVHAACQSKEGGDGSAAAALLTDRLLLQLADAPVAANATTDELSLQLCQLTLYGLPAAAGG